MNYWPDSNRSNVEKSLIQEGGFGSLEHQDNVIDHPCLL